MAAKKKKKKAATKKKAPNPLTCNLSANKVFAVDGGTAYLIKCSGSKGATDLGHLTAKSAADALKKARAFLRRTL